MRAMRARAILGMAAVTCTGCTLTSGEMGGDEGQTGEVGERLATYSYDIATADDRHVGEQFHVAQGGSVSATMAVRWAPKANYPCLAPAINLVLTKRSPPVDQIGGRSFFPKAAKKTETWAGLAEGNYDLRVETNNDNPACVLVGHVDVIVKP